MAENIDHLTLEHLRHIQAVNRCAPRKNRFATVAISVLLPMDVAAVNQRLDSREKKLEHIKQRLELREESP
ncbi:MAG: hypothetical protein N3A55_09015 [Methylohalobius sp.]|nr:hypothetical protein [Methylohalobius sp.]